jgi:1-deoxy-D-xylulose-5-phosphate synthase
VLFALDRAGAVGEDGETHQGIYDIALFKAMPNLIFFAPADGNELAAFMKLSLSLNVPCMMRYPKAFSPCANGPMRPLEIGKGIMMRERAGARILVCAVGPLAYAAADASDALEQLAVPADVYNVRFLSHIDEEYLASLCARYDAILMVEDGVRIGGFGETLAAIAARRGLRANIRSLGFDNMPHAQASREALLDQAGLNAKGIQKALEELQRSLGPESKKNSYAANVAAATMARPAPISAPGEVQHVR